MSVGGVALAAMAPVSLLEAAPLACLVNAGDYPDACGDWTVDDMCSAYPPYAFNTGAARAHTVPLMDSAADVDHHWIC